MLARAGKIFLFDGNLTINYSRERSSVVWWLLQKTRFTFLYSHSKWSCKSDDLDGWLGVGRVLLIDNNWSVFVSEIQAITWWISVLQFSHAFTMVIPCLLSVYWSFAKALWKIWSFYWIFVLNFTFLTHVVVVMDESRCFVENIHRCLYSQVNSGILER